MILSFKVPFHVLEIIFTWKYTYNCIILIHHVLSIITIMELWQLVQSGTPRYKNVSICTSCHKDIMVMIRRYRYQEVGHSRKQNKRKMHLMKTTVHSLNIFSIKYILRFFFGSNSTYTRFYLKTHKNQRKWNTFCHYGKHLHPTYCHCRNPHLIYCHLI